MSDLEKLETGFLDTLAVLKDALPEIIVVGGWCPYLYAHYIWKKPVLEIPTTTDIDLGVLETGPRRFEMTLYKKLVSAGYASERVYEGEALPVEFIYKKRAVKLKVEFITSFETSDDTLNRFLGSELACNRIEAFELLLKRTVTVPILINRSGAEIGAVPASIQKKKIKARTVPIKIRNELLTVKVPSPEIFFYHKAITFVMRSSEFKRDKDLFYAYFILKFHPDRAVLLAALAGLKKDEYFSAFRENIREYLSDFSSPGYLILRPFLRGWIEEGGINEEIRNTFKDVFRLF